MPTTTKRRPTLLIGTLIVAVAIAVGAWLAVPPEPAPVRSPAPPVAAPPSAPAAAVEREAPAPPPVVDEPRPQRKKKPARANVDDLEF